MREYRMSYAVVIDIVVFGRDVEDADNRAMDVIDYLNTINLPNHVNINVDELVNYEVLDAD